MTRIASLAAAAILASILGTPAHAGGSVSVSYHPTDPQHAQALGAGLRIYGLVKGLQNGSITQNGIGNAAGLAQNGAGNFGVVHQHGNGHEGTVQQNGNGNAYGLFQFGQNTSGHAVQNGNGQSGATFQYGW